MTTSVRYKFIQNTTGAALTTDTFQNQTDGDDKPLKMIRHPLVAADFGGGVGQIDNVGGLILDIMPINSNILWFDLDVFRPSVVGGINQYNSVNNQLASINGVASTFEASEFVFWVAADNTLRIYDKSHTLTAPAPLQIGDVIIARVTTGTRQNSLDFL